MQQRKKYTKEIFFGLTTQHFYRFLHYMDFRNGKHSYTTQHT